MNAPEQAIAAVIGSARPSKNPEGLFGRIIWRMRFSLFLLSFSLVLGLPGKLRAQGGPPYYTNDPQTPGDMSWEINLGYMPFLYNGQSTVHTPDLDINFGLGKSIQLTFENAWLRVKAHQTSAEYGLGQDVLGVKWHFYQGETSGLGISVFPQLAINNPDDSVRRGITPPGASLTVPVEFSKRLGPIHVNWEIGYDFVHLGPDGWLVGLVAGHEMTNRLELDVELYGIGTFRTSQDTIGAGARYKLHPLLILLLMAGRSVAPVSNSQPYFVGYFGLQVLLPPKPFDE
jgi:hypothetical protein